MLEAIALAVIEKVLSQYISDVISKRRSERTRAEVIEAVKAELSHTEGMQKQLDALTVAVRELDYVVKDDKSLRWQHDLLTVDPPRRVVGKKPLEPELALAQLRESIAQRRQVLQIPAIPQTTGQHPSNADEPEQIRFIPPEAAEGEQGSDARTQLTPWQEKVISLQSEIRKERRQAKEK